MKTDNLSTLALQNYLFAPKTLNEEASFNFYHNIGIFKKNNRPIHVWKSRVPTVADKAGSNSQDC